MRWIGLGMLVVSILLLGRMREQVLRDRVEDQHWLLRLMDRLMEQIESYHLPLDVIYTDFSAEAGAEGWKWGECLSTEGLHGLLSHLGKDTLPQSAVNALKSLASALGTSGKNEQISWIRQCRDTLEPILEKEKQDLASRIRINRTVTVCGALMTVILFL